ncbi:DUF1707 domain-containing protein [Actinophytocola sp.]|uniref:DUF1707 SHOCT-like domain-containing protein n=1 Tax=Actinophytocola sp. TaxID=1872138 RepID=UPI002D7F5F11|nr:DUF1707 domain-containing protein [Actinophytocola sp.]HET9142763.1 DUF1707 domain-containing protein [Actinophytocola sp.]
MIPLRESIVGDAYYPGVGEGREAEIRIGDIERGEARAMLDIHLGHGRLDAAEHSDRVGRAEAARTRQDIAALFDDLPPPRPELSTATEVVPAQPAGQVSSSRSEVGNRIAAVWTAVMVPTAILLTVLLGAWWMFIVFAAGLMVIGAVTSDGSRKPPSES